MILWRGQFILTRSKFSTFSSPEPTNLLFSTKYRCFVPTKRIATSGDWEWVLSSPLWHFHTIVHYNFVRKENNGHLNCLLFQKNRNARPTRHSARPAANMATTIRAVLSTSLVPPVCRWGSGASFPVECSWVTCVESVGVAGFVSDVAVNFFVISVAADGRVGWVANELEHRMSKPFTTVKW